MATATKDTRLASVPFALRVRIAQARRLVDEFERQYGGKFDSLADLFGQPKPESIQWLQLLLAGLDKALRAALSFGYYLRQLALSRDRHGRAPGKIVTIHPQVTRGPDVRMSTCRSSADLVMT